ncbi:MAG: hypothetical protein H6Q68_2680 [Firmicutes bacterium]|nr:hypothetical protein [Bacillota bacterium]
MTLRRYTAAMFLSTALAFITPGGVDAATVTTSTVTASAGDVSISSSKTMLSSDNIAFAQVLSSSYNRTVSTSEIIRLRADFDFGFGDISLVYATAVYSGRPVDEISRHRYENMGWGEIAKLYGVKVKDLKKGNDDVVNAARGRGVDVTYIEINDDQGRDDGRDYKNDQKKDNKGNVKYNNGKGHEHKK